MMYLLGKLKFKKKMELKKTKNNTSLQKKQKTNMRFIFCCI